MPKMLRSGSRTFWRQASEHVPNNTGGYIGAGRFGERVCNDGHRFERSRLVPAAHSPPWHTVHVVREFLSLRREEPLGQLRHIHIIRSRTSWRNNVQFFQRRPRQKMAEFVLIKRKRIERSCRNHRNRPIMWANTLTGIAAEKPIAALRRNFYRQFSPMDERPITQTPPGI